MTCSLCYWESAEPTTLVGRTRRLGSPLHLSHGKNGGGKLRPITPILQRGLVEQGITADVERIDEFVFDYAPTELAEVCDSIAARMTPEPVPPRQFFPVIEPPSTFPSLARPEISK